MKAFAWPISIAAMVCMLIYAMMQSGIEDGKNHTFMMEACVESGGQWVKNFGPTWNCVRPAGDGATK